MPKAIAVQAIFLIGVIAIFLFFIVGIFWGWIDVTKFTTSEATCKVSWINYCSAITSGTKPPKEWNKECNQYVEEPSLQTCCKGELKGLKCP